METDRMRKTAFILLLAALALSAAAQEVTVNEGRFTLGDDPAWSKAAFNDAGWQVLALDKDWTLQGIKNPNA